jgi:transcriptional regulator with XRE-family HTH domain
MGEHDGTPVGLLIFGCQQRALRERAGFTQAELARRASYSESLVRSVESGRRRPKPEYVRCVDDALGAQGLLVAAAKHIVQEKYPTWFLPHVQYELEATSFNAYDCNVVNGLLQTQDYARAVLGAACPSWDDNELERRVTARLDRQCIFHRNPPPTMSFVVEEWVLRRPIGGRATQKAQLHRLLEAGDMRHVSIQVMPLECESHAGFDGPMHLLGLPDGHRYAYVEGQGGSHFFTKPDDLNVFEQRLGNIRAQALTMEESLSFIDRLAGEL